MNIITPGIGLVFWMVLSFSIVLFLLKKFAWKPILDSLKERETSIEDALKSAEQAREEMAKLNAENEKILAQARAEKEAILKDAKETQNMIIAEAQNKAKLEGEKLIASAKVAIENEKNAAMASIKEQMVDLSIEIAEKVIKQELSDKDKQSHLIEDLLKEVKLK